MENSTLENCQTCLRPFPDPESPDKTQKTQWVSLCRCALEYSPNSKFSIEVCDVCKKRVVSNPSLGVEHAELCSCSTPNPKSLPAQLRHSEKPEPVTLDLSTIGMAEADFPIERFKPIGILGQSPKADVLLCRDKQSGNKVAVKCFKRLSAKALAVFEQDARLLSKLSHTNIAKVVHFGIHNGKTPYIVTDYKEGFSLEQYFKCHGVPSHDVAVKVLIALCEAILYAQKEGLMHMNVKPGNIIFLDDMNSEPSVAVTDFSMPKVRETEELIDARDAHYMSGDEARNMDYSELSEMYSVGCIGYSLLTGKTPFASESARELKNKHALELPARISNVNFDNKRPRDLEEVIERCLEKNPKDRFESIERLKERLEVFPRRVKFQLESIEAAKNRQKMIKFGIIALVIVVLLVVVSFALSRH